MAVFFSGEDDRELIDNTVRSNGVGCFLSVIVNNKREVIARVCKLEKGTKKVMYHSSFSSWEEEEQFHIVWYKECIVLAPEVEYGFGEEFYERFKKLSTPAPKQIFSSNAPFPSRTIPNGYQAKLFPPQVEEQSSPEETLALIISADTTDDIGTALKELLVESKWKDFGSRFIVDIESILEEGLELQIYDIKLIQQTREEMEKYRGTRYDLIAQLYIEAVDGFLNTYASQGNKTAF